MLVFLHFSLSNRLSLFCVLLVLFFIWVCCWAVFIGWLVGWMRQGGPGITLAAHLKMFLVCLCAFPKKPASLAPLSGGPRCSPVLGFASLRLKQPFSFDFSLAFQM